MASKCRPSTTARCDFVQPNGESFDSVSRNHTRPIGDWRQLPAVHERAGIHINAKTAATLLGRRPDGLRAGDGLADVAAPGRFRGNVIQRDSCTRFMGHVIRHPLAIRQSVVRENKLGGRALRHQRASYMETTLLTAGLACLIASVIGGLKAFSIEIPLLTTLPRIDCPLCSRFGALLHCLRLAAVAARHPHTVNDFRDNCSGNAERLPGNLGVRPLAAPVPQGPACGTTYRMAT